MIFMPASQFHVCLFCSGPSDCYGDIFANLRLKLLWTLARLDSTGHPRATPWSLRVTSTFLQRQREEHGTFHICFGCGVFPKESSQKGGVPHAGAYQV